MRRIYEEIYILVPQGDNKFKHYAWFLMKLLRIRKKQNFTIKLIKYQCNTSDEEKGNFGFQPEIKINPHRWRLQRSFYVFGHGFQNGLIGEESPESRVRCCDLLKYINDLFSYSRLTFRPEVILTECYGYLHIEGNYPNISIDAVSSVDVPLTLGYKARNLSLTLYVVRSWIQKYYHCSLLQKPVNKKPHNVDLTPEA